MTGNFYDGTSAYKIEQYYNYTNETTKKQEEKKDKRVRQSILTHKRLVVVTSVVFVVAIAFLYFNVVLIQTSARHDDLTRQLEDIRVRNTQLSFEIASGVDLAAVEAKAKNEFGMQQPESHQNVYVDVVQNDYAESFSVSDTKPGFVDTMITSLKAFLAYIG